MYWDGKLWIGQAKNETKDKICILPQMSNRHGLVAGATGTGKTVTLKVLAESFSDMGVPVFMADVKGDLAGMCMPGTDSEDMQERIRRFGLEGNFAYKGYPTCIWDVLGEGGHPLRTTVSDMGPVLLSVLLDLNDTQSDILSIIFQVADDEGLLLLDLKDLRSMIEYVGENAKDLTLTYGNITKPSLGAITRSISALEEEGGNRFFGEPALDIFDWIRTDESGRGYINVLHAAKIIHTPRLYTTFMLWMMSELFEDLPEEGDLEKPKIVFFFDEAHLMFDIASRALMQKIEQVVKLIRSRGVGIYFVTQSPSDIPNAILSQLGNRVQHALRAYTPTDMKMVRAAANSFRINPEFSTEEAISNLATGEALISFLDAEGAPGVVQKCSILPPQSRMGAIENTERFDCLLSDGLGEKYDKAVDRESAYEILLGRFDEAREALERAEAEKREAAEAKERERQEAKDRAEREREEREAERKADRERREQERADREAERLAEKERREAEREAAQKEKEFRKKTELLRTGVNSMVRTFGRNAANSIWRGVFGNRKK